MAKTKKTPSGEIAIRSCRYNGRSIACTWEQNGDAYSVNFHDNPLPSFEKTLKALASHAASLCEFPERDASKIEPTGITLRPLGDDNAQALIVAKKKLKRTKRVMNISTPLLAMYPGKDAETKGSDAMDEETARAIEKFVVEVKKYIVGERAQGKLALEEEEPAKPDEGPKTPEFPEMTEPAKT